MEQSAVMRNALFSISFGILGAIVSNFTVKGLCLDVHLEIIQSLGSISAIASALVGWSVGWIAQNKQLLILSTNQESINDFDRLSELQIQLIWTWAVVFSCSIIAVVLAIVSRELEIYAFYVSVFFLVVAFYFVVYLFRQMLVLSKFKIELDSNERHRLRVKGLFRDVNDTEA